MLAWYVLYSKPRQERIAYENLDRQGYETYLPLVRSRRRRQGRSLLLVEPMFPRYLFVRLNDVTDDWGPLRSTRGVSNLVRFGLQAAFVPDGLVDDLRDREDDTGVQIVAEPGYRPGDRVRIIDGPMAGYGAIFKARTGKERVLILLEIAGSLARIQLGVQEIEPISS